MTPAVIRIVLAVPGSLGLVAIVRLAAWPLADVTLASPPDPPRPSATADAGVGVAAESVAAVVARDPFRIGRRPALVAYDPARLVDQDAAPAPKPVLTLVGLLSGADPSAVVEGFPGVEGSRVVRVGDVVAGLRTKTIDHDKVVIVGTDTTWVLRVREPWKN